MNNINNLPTNPTPCDDPDCPDCTAATRTAAARTDVTFTCPECNTSHTIGIPADLPEPFRNNTFYATLIHC